MKKIDADKAVVIQEYNAASTEGRALIEKLFGKDTLVFDAKENLNSIQDIIDHHGVDDDLRFLIEYEGSNEVLLGSRAFALASMLANLVNSNRVANWDDSNERKWFPWFYLNKTKDDPSGFQFHDARYDNTHSTVGSRLCFFSEEDCVWAAQKFPEIYKQLMKYINKK